MTSASAPRRFRLLLVGALGTAILVSGIWWAAGRVFDEDPAPAWRTVEREGVRVQIPGDWERADMEDCEFEFVRWIPADEDPCGQGAGLAFYGSATFDPRHGPGIRRSTRSDADTAWAGYVYAGDYAVYVATQRRATAETILASVTPKR